MTALLNKHYSGHRKTIEEEGDQRTPGKEIWRKKLDNRFQAQLEEDGGNSKRDEWYVVSPSQGISQVSQMRRLMQTKAEARIYNWMRGYSFVLRMKMTELKERWIMKIRMLYL